MPSFIAPKMPVPLAQNSTRIATNFSMNSSWGQAFARREDALDQALGASAKLADHALEVDEFADDRTEDQRQDHGRQMLELDDHRDAQTHRGQAESHRHRSAQTFGQTGAEEGAGEAANRDGGAVDIRSYWQKHVFFLW